MKKNFFKPRYKICYQTKNRIWFHKNSRLRGNKFFRFNYFKMKYVYKFFDNLPYLLLDLKLKSMKWIMIKRFMFTSKRRKYFFKYHYGNVFKNKQQLKAFYGKIKEYQLQNSFLSAGTKNKIAARTTLANSLEQRLDVILYRTRMLPTIFACNQYISHNGLMINNNKIKLPSYKLQSGEIISFKKDHWSLFYVYLGQRLVKRVFGQNIYLYKKHKSNMKYTNFKRSFRNNFKLIYRTHKLKLQYFLLEKVFKKHHFIHKEQHKLKIIYMLFNQLKKYMSKIDKISPYMKKWHYPYYNKIEIELILLIMLCYKYIFKIHYIIEQSTITFIANNGFLMKKISSKEKKKFANTQLLLLKKNKSNYNIQKKKLIRLIKMLFSKGTYLHQHYINRLDNRRLKRQKKIIRRNPYKQLTPHWYIPQYLEIDYHTLRISFINISQPNEVIYPFLCSFDTIITFYKNKGL